MNRFSLWSLFLLVPATALLLASVPGCGKKDEPQEPDISEGPRKPKKITKTDGTGAGKKTKVAIKAGDGVIKGKVILDGPAPEYSVIKAIADQKDDSCKAPEDLKYQNVDQNWIVGPDKGVANVVVFLKAAKDQYFEPAEEDKKRDKDAVVDQPYCAFVPNLVLLYPEYFDGSKYQKTGQKLLVLNSAKFPHNTKIQVDESKNTPDNLILKPGEKKEISLNYQSRPISLKCDFHPWMSGTVWVVDHPYGAVTGLNGEFEIKNVPTGMKLNLVAWHPGADYFLEGGQNGKEMEFKSGANEVTLNIKKK